MTLHDLLMLALFPVFCVIAHAIFSRALRAWPRQLVAVLAPAGPALGMIYALGDTFGSKLFVAFCCAALAHVYFHVFNMSETARRIRILVSIKEEGRMPMDVDAAKNAIQIRLARLRDLRQVKHQESKYASTPGVLTYVAVVMDAYERLLFPNKSFQN